MVPVADIDRTSYLLVLGANPLASNGSMMTAPGFGRRLRELRSRGGKVVVIDPRRTETAAVADEHHFIRPGTDAASLLALAHEVLASDAARPASYVDNVEQVRAAVAEWTPERAAAVTGIDADVIRRIATEFGTADRAACYGRNGVSTQQFGAICQWAVQVLNIVTGNLDRPGGTLFPRPAVDILRGLGRGHLGAWRSRVRGLPEFGGELPSATISDEILTPGKGQIRAMVTVAGYINETTRHADVILPPTSPLERDHYDLTFYQLAVRNVARWNAAVLPKPADARHDWEIFRGVGTRYARRALSRKRLRRTLTSLATLRMSPARIVDLGLRTGPYKLSLGRLRRTPPGIDLGPLQPCLPGALRNRTKRIDLAPEVILGDLPRAAAALLDVAESDGLLLKGRPRHQLLMNPADLKERSLVDGDLVRVSSASGSVEVEVAATDDMMPGVVSLPHGFGHARSGVRLSVATGVAGVSVNDVTDAGLVDELAGTAAVNGVPVTVEATS